MEIDEYLSGDELKSPDKQNDSMIANLTIINLFLELYTKKVESISSQAYRYDFDETTRANGYRTQVKIFAKILNDIQLTFSRYKINSQSLFMETSSSKSRIKSWKEFLIAYYPIICTVAKLMEVFPNQLIADKEDIFNKFILEHYASYSHPVFYGKLFGFQYNTKFNAIINLLGSSMASYAFGYETSSNKIVQAMVMFSKNSYFILHPNKRAGKLRKLLRAPTVEFCKSLMSLTDDLGFSTISSIVGPHVNINTKVMIRIEDLYIKKVDNTEFCVLDGAHTLREKIRESVECRLLSLNRYEGQKKFVNDHNLDEGSVLPDSDNLLIYFHGGGFIGLSAKICDIYLREWANSLKFPIFSIDYKLSPEAIFPYAVHECFYTYCVILERGKSVGWNGKKVIFFGDSAGGNLVFAVTQMAIKHNIRIPDGLICAYPSCDTSLSLSPSRCLVHIDPFLSTGFLSVARRAYFGISDEVYNNSENTMRKNKRSTVSECPNQPSPDFIKLLHLIDIEDEVIGYYPTHIKDDDQRVPDSPFNQFEMLEDDPCENPLASPTLTDPEVLKRFPPVRMIISDTDPFLDEGLMMCKKLASSNVNVKVDIVSDLPHGFLQFILASIEVKNISDMIVARMKELLFLS